MSITGKHVGFEDLPWVRSPKEKGERRTRGKASARKKTSEEDMLQKPRNSLPDHPPGDLGVEQELSSSNVESSGDLEVPLRE